MNSYPHELSGGQQQRVMIAMAIACEPKLLIADEPTTALDVTIQKQILELIAKLQETHHMSVLFITHDLAVVGEIADHVVVMQNGEIKEQGTARQIFETPAASLHQGAAGVPPERGPAADALAGDRGLHGRRRLAARASRSSASAATHTATRSCWRCKNLSKHFSLEGRAVQETRRSGGERRNVQACARQDAWAGRGIRLGQDHGRPHADALARRHAAARCCSTVSTC